MHTQLKIKCMGCGLHFIICTEEKGRHSNETIYCPECGQREGRYIMWSEEVHNPIYTVVPGTADLLGASI